MRGADYKIQFNRGYVNGFTLMELLITLVIAALITGISATAYSRLSSNAAIKATSQDLLVSLRHAKSLAIANKREVIFIIDLNKRLYGLVGDKRLRSLDSTLDIQLFSARFHSGDQAVSQIRFAPDGSSSGGEIKISNGKKIYRIVIEWLTGKVELKHG